MSIQLITRHRSKICWNHTLQQKSAERLGGTRTIPIDVWLIAATNRNLTQMMGDKLFRSDLYYRFKIPSQCLRCAITANGRSSLVASRETIGTARAYEPHEASTRPAGAYPVGGVPMTPMELKNLKRALEAMQTELEDLLHNSAVRAVDLSADMLDQVQRASEHDMEMGNLERGSARLREVLAALQRIHLGTFGICLECDEEISLKRLVAVPWTSSCIACQEAVDSSRIPPWNTIKDRLANAA